MKRFAARCAVVGVLVCLPLCALAQGAQGAKSAKGAQGTQGAPAAQGAHAGQDPVDTMLQQLGLTPEQETKIDKLVAAFKEKQQNLPGPGEVLVEDRELVKQLITGAPFDRVKADALTKQAAAAMQARMLNRIELRNQIFQVLTPQQREQFMKKVMEAMGKGQ
jgi:Spy/CpxP family protein refolding chaperone